MKDISTIWPEWQLEEKIGSGAFGSVYKIKREDEWNTYYAALKTISIPKDEEEVDTLREQGMDEDSITEYYHSYSSDIYREIALMEKLKGNTNIVSYEDHKILKNEYGYGCEIFIRMQLLTPLSKIIAKQPLSQEEVLKLGIDICRALELCEKNHIMHRDIKPANIFVGEDGSYKLGDFGVARIAENATFGTITGTQIYMAPEILYNKKYDSRVDIYSLGIVLYQLLNKNRLPFMAPAPQPIGANDRMLAYQRRMKGEKVPSVPDVSSEINSTILKACEFEQEKRYINATEFKKALEAVLYADNSKEKRTVINSVKPTKKPIVKIIAGIAVILVLGLIGLVMGLGKENKGADNNENTNSAGNSLIPSTIIETTQDAAETATTEEEPQIDVSNISEIKITSSLSYILVGDTDTMYCNVGTMYLQSSDRLKWSTSDSSIATIDSMGRFQALKAGRVTVQAEYEGLKNSVEIQILSVDENVAKKAMTANYEHVSLNTYGDVTLEYTLGKDVPESFEAYYYYSAGLSLDCEWKGLSDNVLSLEVTNAMSEESGTLTVYITPKGEPENVIGVSKVEISIN